MTQKNRIILYILLLTAGWFCTASGLLWENPGLFQDREEWMFPPGSDPFSPRMILEMRDELSLSPAQISRISKMVQAFEESLILSLAELKIRELRLATLIRDSNVSRKDVRRKIKEIGKFHSARLFQFLTAMLEIRQVLTPAQQSLLASFRSIHKREISPR